MTIEVARYTASDDAALLAARPAMVEAIRDAFPGFLRATLAQTNDGTWVDIFYWTDRPAANRAVAGESELGPYAEFANHIAVVASSEIADVPVPEAATEN